MEKQTSKSRCELPARPTTGHELEQESTIYWWAHLPTAARFALVLGPTFGASALENILSLGGQLPTFTDEHFSLTAWRPADITCNRLRRRFVPGHEIEGKEKLWRGTDGRCWLTGLSPICSTSFALQQISGASLHHEPVGTEVPYLYDHAIAGSHPSTGIREGHPVGLTGDGRAALP